MIGALIKKLLGRAIGMPGANPGYGTAALGHVAEKLAEEHLPEAADDIRLIRDAKLAKPSADIAKSDAVVAKAAAAAETDNIKKRAAAQKECESLQKKIEAAKDPAERKVLLAERVAAQAERMADAYERFAEAKARLDAKGSKVSFDPENLDLLIALGREAEQSLIEAKPGDGDLQMMAGAPHEPEAVADPNPPEGN